MKIIPTILLCLPVILGSSQVVPDAMGFVHPKILVQSGTAINTTGTYTLTRYKGNDTFIVNNNTQDWYLGQDSGLSWSQPLVFINNSTKKIRVQSGIHGENCQYVKIIGWGSDSTYGFEIRGGGVSGSFEGMQKGILIEGCRFTGGINGGVWLKNEVAHACDFYNFWRTQGTADSLKYAVINNYTGAGNHPFDSIWFLHNKIDSCGGEGMYFGSTDFIMSNGQWRDAVPCQGNSRPPAVQLANCRFDSNEVTVTGRTGVQLNQATRGTNTVTGNYLHNLGYEFNTAQGAGVRIGWQWNKQPGATTTVSYNVVDTCFLYTYDIEEAANVHHNYGDHHCKVYYPTLHTNTDPLPGSIFYANNIAITPMLINFNTVKSSQSSGNENFAIYGGVNFISGNDTCFNTGKLRILSTPFNVNPTCDAGGVDTTYRDSTYQITHDTLIVYHVPESYIRHDSSALVPDTVIRYKMNNRKYVKVTRSILKSYIWYDTIPAHDSVGLCHNCAVHDTTIVVIVIGANGELNDTPGIKESNNYAINYKGELWKRKITQ